MREIKFRAWDKEDNFMVVWEDFNEVYENQPLKSLSSGKDYDHLGWMQYTGLKDKNGTEIYEGDIVTKQGKNNPLIGDVYFDEAMFRVRWGVMENGKLADSGRSDGIHQYLSSQLGLSPGYEMEWEVIGNIYENKDLL